MNIDMATVTTLFAIGGPVASVFLLGWWLSGRFRKIEIAQRDQADDLAQTTREQIERLAKDSRDQLDRHEEQDQVRHDDNLERFRTISVSLAKLGSSNGGLAGPHH